MFMEFSHYGLVMFPIPMLKWPKESNLGVKAFILAHRLMVLSTVSGKYEMMGLIHVHTGSWAWQMFVLNQPAPVYSAWASSLKNDVTQQWSRACTHSYLYNQGNPSQACPKACLFGADIIIIILCFFCCAFQFEFFLVVSFLNW